MKKATLLLFGMLFALNIFAYNSDKLYIMGDGCGVAWGSGAGAALEMTKVENNVFTWIGILYKNDDEKRFKFLTGADWDPHITCQKQTDGHEIVTSGVSYDLFDNTSGPKDNCFQVTETGTYIVNVDLNNMKMVVTKIEKESVEDLTQLHLHITSTATGESERIAMTEVSDGIFVWYGSMVEGTFNFFTAATGDDKSLQPLIQMNAVKNNKYDLLYYSAESATGYSFRVTEAGNYTILVDLNTLKIRFLQLNLNELKIIGSALNENADWHGEGIAMHKVADGEFVYVGPLYNRDGNPVDGGDMGKFKFLNYTVADLIACNEISQKQLVEIGNQYAMSFQSHADDNKFHVAESGIYTVYVNMKTMSMKFMKVDKSSLYLTGVDSEGDIAMDEDVENAGVFTWTGELTTGQNFYFLNYNGYANSSIVATEAQEQAITLETEYPLNSGTATNYFTVSETAEYIVSVDLNTMKMTVKKDDEATNLDELDKEQIFTVIPGDRSLSIRINDGKIADRVEVYDATGKNIVCKLNASGIVQIGENISKGFYIVKVSFEGVGYSAKIILN